MKPDRSAATTEFGTPEWHRQQMRTFAAGLNDDFGPMFGRDVCVLIDQYEELAQAMHTLVYACYVLKHEGRAKPLHDALYEVEHIVDRLGCVSPAEGTPQVGTEEGCG